MITGRTPSAPHNAEGRMQMTISPGPPPWPIPPSWTLVPPTRREPEPPVTSRPAAEPPGASAVPGDPPAREITVLGADGAGAQDVLDALPAVPGVTVDARSVFGTPGFARVYELVRAAERALSEGADGIVILPGAGAMEETAWALELLHTGDAPIVLTADLDRAGDVADAIRVAAAGLKGLGCLLVTHGEIHAARHVSSTGATGTSAFASPAAGPLGRVAGETVRLLWRPPERFTVRGPHGGRSPRIGLHTAALGDDGELLRAVAQHCDGLVVAAAGSGGLPEAMTPVLAELAARVPVVLASPAVHGGGFPTTTLDPLKARVLMHLLLDAGRDRGAVLEAFAAIERGAATEL
jgi:L-asparaginase